MIEENITIYELCELDSSIISKLLTLEIQNFHQLLVRSEVESISKLSSHMWPRPKYDDYQTTEYCRNQTPVEVKATTK
jgi:hypothetical protein